MRVPRSSLARTALSPASALYSLVTRARNRLYDGHWLRITRLPVPVASIGNITVGGTGKTPIVIHLAKRLLEAGIRPLVLSRGYGSDGSGTRIVSDGAAVLLDAAEGGDEPVLIARSLPGVPVVVDPDRVRGGLAAVRRFNPGIVLLDDGYQHRRLARDLDIVLLDAVEPFGHYSVLPSGLLREPFRGLARAGLFIVTHAPASEPLGTLTSVVRRYNPSAPIVRAWHVPEGLMSVGPAANAPAPRIALDGLRCAPVYAFCGIANPQGFLATIREVGARLVGARAFADHHPYTPGEIAALARDAAEAGASFVLTTEKDAVRLTAPPGDLPLLALRIRMRIEPEEPVLERLMDLIRGARSEDMRRA